MSMLWLGGPRMNVLANAQSVTASPSADALFPTTKLYDGYPGDIFRFGSLTAAPTITVDLDQYGGDGSGGFETSSGFPVGWTTGVTGTATVTRETNLANVQFGNASAKLFAGTGVSSIYRDTVVRSGGSVKVTVWMQADATSAPSASIRDLTTGQYWTGTAWSAASTSWASLSGAGAFTRFETEVEAASFSEIGGATTTLRLQIANAVAASDAWVDGCEMVPAVDFCSIHGHNIDARSAPTLRTSTDNFVASDTLRATFDLAQPSFYAYLGASFKASSGFFRYWRVAFADTNSSASGAIYVGEMVLGEAAVFRSAALPFDPSYAQQHVRVARRFGAPNIYGMGNAELASVPIKVLCESVAERDLFYDEWRRLRGGYPVAVVPHNADGHEGVFLGIASDAMPHSWTTTRYAVLSTTVDEMGLPLIIG